MLYDCKNQLDKNNFLDRANMLARREDLVELRTRRQRSLSQNSYLHCLFEYFGSQYGETAEYVKEKYFKLLVNEKFFVVGKSIDRFTGETRWALRSTTDLTTEEMSVCIDRFRNWSSKVAGIYLPTAEEGSLLRQCEIEVSKAQRYL